MSGRLAEAIAGFARALRDAGLPVGPAATVDAVAAVEAVGLARRDDLYWTLHATLVTRHEESAVFDAVFRAVWRTRTIAGEASMPAAADGDGRPDAGARRAAEALGGVASPGPHARDSREVAARLAASDADRLRRKDFGQMSADEIAEARRLVAALAMPDDRRRTRRHHPDRRGRHIDGRATLRATLRGGGASPVLLFRAPRLRRPPVVALVDISGSMTVYSRLVLHFLHALGASGRPVHAFTFATQLTNVSRDLARRDPDEALARAAARAPDWEGGTRLAAALRRFNRDWSRRVLGGGAIVLLVTDGLERDGGDDLGREADRLRRSCRRLVWLNPLLRFSGFQPRAAGVRTLLAQVDEFRPIHDLHAMGSLVGALSGPAPPSLARPTRRIA